MTDPFEQAALAERAERRRRRDVAMSTGLKVHAAVFVAVQLLLVAIWASSDADTPWFLYALFGWGAGLAAHVVAVRSARAA